MTHVFYHNADLDGHCSGAICKLAIPQAHLHGINYGDPFPWEKIARTDTVYMVDFSLQPFEDMARLQQSCQSFVWIDHHKSAMIEWEEWNRVIRYAYLDNEAAACEACWRHFYPNNPLPPAVILLGRYDIWKHHEVEGALEFQYGMRLYNTWPENQELWQELCFGEHSSIEPIKEKGRTVLAYETRQNEKYAKAFAFETTLDGLRCIAINRGMTNSLLFDSVYDPAKHDAMLSFARKGDHWTVSLYATKPDVDVSAVCKARGGGGHKGAAGFQCFTLPFLVKKGEGGE